MRLLLDLVPSEDGVEVPRLNFPLLSRIMGEFLAEWGLSQRNDVSTALSFVTKEAVTALNSTYRDIPSPTDVLSFPLWEEGGEFCPPQGWDVLPLGDVVVCPAAVRENADAAGIGYENEMVLVIIHGLLHLIGYDHHDEAGKSEMWSQQETLVQRYLECNQGGLMSE